MRQLFGTDGIRGIANKYPMTAEVAMKVGAAAASLFCNSHRPKILIGKDTRLSGYMLEYAMTSGICTMGANVLLAGPLPTPGIAFITRNMRADAGIVISASHNPYQYNGIKVFASDGYKLPDHVERELERRVESFESLDLPSYEHIGQARRIDDVQGRYIVHLKNTFPSELSLEGITIVVDCAHGAAYRVAPLIFEELGARVITIGVSPDGKNINDGCGALFPDAMAQAVKKYGAHAGIAFDGDADRVILADEKGNILDGDVLMAICAQDMLNRGVLSHRTVVSTVMSNLGLEIALKKMNASLVRTSVGDRYVVEEMRKSGYVLGGEQSGHIIFLHHSTTGDGILSALQVLAVMVKHQRPLSELSRIMERVPQRLVNVPVNGSSRQINTIPGYETVFQKIETLLGDEGRMVVRSSGTEPVIRIMVEATKEELINCAIEEMVDFFRKNLD